MTVGTTPSRVRYEGNGVTATFAFNGKVFAAADLVVQILTRATDAVVETLTITTDYSVTVGTSSASITVVSGKIPSSTQDILIYRAIAQTQDESLPTGDPFPAKTLERGLDRVTVIAQDLTDGVDRAIKISRAEASSFSGELPALTGNGEKYPRLKSDLSGFEWIGLASQGDLEVSAFAETLLVDPDASAARSTLGLGNISVLSGTAQGDIAYYNGSAWARLAAGISGQVLRTQGTGANPVWGNAGGWVPLATVTASNSASVDFTTNIDSTYKIYAIVFDSVQPATDGATLQSRLGNGGSFDSGSGNYAYTNVTLKANSATTTETISATGSAISIILTAAGVGNVSTEGVDGGVLFIYNPANASKYTSLNGTMVQSDTAGDTYNVRFSGSRLEAAAHDRIQFFFSSGNIASGTFTLYGIRGT